MLILSLNMIIYFIMLEKGIFLQLQDFTNMALEFFTAHPEPQYPAGLCAGLLPKPTIKQKLAAIRMLYEFLTPVGCHTWRATGVTDYLENGGPARACPADRCACGPPNSTTGPKTRSQLARLNGFKFSCCLANIARGVVA